MIKGDRGIQGIQGPKGETGATGARGAQGPKGDKGDTGARGAQGPKGDKGATGARGAQGPKGDKGDTGPQGPAGPSGATASVATQTANGLMSKEDKKKLDRIIDDMANVQVTTGTKTYGSNSTIVDGHTTIPHPVDILMIMRTDGSFISILFPKYNTNYGSISVLIQNTESTCEITWKTHSNTIITAVYYAIRFV